ncbi:GNAT family N-acetyltransferase [Algoriphagus sp. PAP.12]|uniref:GNAT family N-acetyltransferase n=1 Tax=Algoriphagus sp. PAP.12 TaxID=2996678 RepID=UPI00227CFC4C|nr:GNAT family N-acetyltransferase [Algoriphagus sp. PAP.12]
MQIESVEIRDVKVGEIPALVEMAQTAFLQAFTEGNKPENVSFYMNDAFTEKQFQKEFEAVGSRFFVAFMNGKIIGYTKVNEVPSQTDIHDSDSLEIARLYVLEDYLGLGLGKKLLDLAIDFAKSKKKKYLWLGVWEKNARAIRFYEKNGLKIFGSHPFPFGDEIQTDFLMKIEF